VRDARRLLPEQREQQAQALALRLDRPISILGVIFLLVVLAEGLATNPGLQTALRGTSWALWAVFAGEFALRIYLAPHRARFLRRNWWQIIFLAVPFLRFLRLFWVLRTLRVGRLLSAAVRGSRSAGRLLSNRLGWLASLTTVLVLAAGQLLFEFGDYPTLGRALYDAALATITGEPLSADTALARWLSVGLAGYSVAVVATLAATVGAWFLAPESLTSESGTPERVRHQPPGRDQPVRWHHRKRKGITMIGAFRRLAACALAVGLLTGCGGEDFEAEQHPSPGENARVGDILLRDFRLDPPPDDPYQPYPVGSDVALYGWLLNEGDTADRLLEVSTPDAAGVELVSGTGEPVGPPLELPANSPVQLEPGKSHLLVSGTEQELESGSPIDVRFVFEDAGEATVTVQVRVPAG
jgi:voltage-gated potassium channel